MSQLLMFLLLTFLLQNDVRDESSPPVSFLSPEAVRSLLHKAASLQYPRKMPFWPVVLLVAVLPLMLVHNDPVLTLMMSPLFLLLFCLVVFFV